MAVQTRTFLSIAALVALAACSPEQSVQPVAITPAGASLDAGGNGNGLAKGLNHAKVCPGDAPGEARCHSWVRVDDVGEPLAQAGPSGYTPSDLRAAYNLGLAGGGVGQTIAIVDAYDDPNAESDLAVYRSQFGLPPCTTANGCFRKVNQNGGTSYPRAECGLGGRDLARSRHGERDLPELQDPSRRGELDFFRRISPPRSIEAAAAGGDASSRTRMAAANTSARSTTGALQPSWHRDHRRARATTVMASSSRHRHST